MYFIISTIFVIGFIVTVLGLDFAIGYIITDLIKTMTGDDLSMKCNKGD